MRHLSETGIVLSLRLVRESDLILSLLTKEKGKLVAIAPGARRSRKRFPGGIDLFDFGNFELSTPKTEGQLYVLDGISGKEGLLSMNGELWRFPFASSCLEIADNFSPEGDPECGKLCVTLRAILKALSDAESVEQCFAFCTFFFLVVLRVSGFDLLEHDAELPPTQRQWFQEMLRVKAPIIPYDPDTGYEGFACVLQRTEETLGCPLRSGKRSDLRKLRTATR